MPDESCPHLDEAKQRTAVKSGGVWVHLRLCLGCGHVGCCDDSPNRHASKHAHHTNHPVIHSYEPGEGWGYCFPHDLFAEHLASKPGETPARHYDPPGE